MLRNITGLMEKGSPVAVAFRNEEGEETTLLYCELIQKARFGNSFVIRSQGCSVCAYVFGESNLSPEDYYYRAGRYKDKAAANNASSSLHRLFNKPGATKIIPYSGNDFDILILFLKPERAMRLIQAHAYSDGKPIEFKTGGIASICSDCTVYPLQGKLGISTGCKGSRKHSKYDDEELIVGIPFELAGELDEYLGKIPGTFE